MILYTYYKFIPYDVNRGNIMAFLNLIIYLIFFVFLFFLSFYFINIYTYIFLQNDRKTFTSSNFFAIIALKFIKKFLFFFISFHNRN